MSTVLVTNNNDSGAGSLRQAVLTALPFTVTLTAASSVPVSVGYTTVAGTAVAGVDFMATSGTVVIPAGQTHASFTVAIYGNTTAVSGNHFTVALLGASGMVLSADNAVGTATITTPTFRTVNFGGNIRGVYTDASGQTVTISLHGAGSGVLILANTTGNVDADSVQLSNTNAGSQLVIATSRNATTNIGLIQSTSPLGSILAGSTNLTSDLTLTTVRTVILHSIDGSGQPDGSTITLGAGASAVLDLGTVSDCSIVSGSAIRILAVNSWTDTGTKGTISAPSFGTIASKGNFAPMLNATAGSITTVSVKGAITGGVTSTGAVRNIVAGTVSNATFNVAGDIVQFAAVGAVTNSTVRAGDHLDSFTSAQLLASRLFGGVAITATMLPVDRTAFVGVSASAIGRVNIRGVKNASAFADSFIVAPKLGIVTISPFSSADATGTEGIAAETVAAVVFTPPGSKRIVDRTNYTSGNFVVRML